MSVFDPIRQCIVEATPEEFIRQAVLKHLTEKLLYPKHLISVEKQLDLLVEGENPFPKRRIDILCYTMASKPIPALLIECKADKITKKSLAQLQGYNHYIHAPFIALAGKNQVITGWVNKEGDYQFSEGLPSYESVCNATKY